MKYDAEVAQAVAHWGPHYGIAIDPALVHAVIQRESTHGAKLSAAEPGGHWSYGPMMVYDDTAHAYGISDPSLLKDPALGIWYGVRYLGQQLKTFWGDTARAVSAYNAGPGNAVRNRTTDRFPNQPYVDAVLSFWNRYKGAVTGGAAALVIVGGLTWYLLARRRRAA